MNIEQKVILSELEVKLAIVQYLKANHLKPDNDIQLIFKNGEAIEQVLFTDLEILWTASKSFSNDEIITIDGSHFR